MTTRILVGDVRTRLADVPDASVHTCVTSPPYFGLRDYGTASWDGGSSECKHRVGGQVQDSKAPGAIVTGIRPGVDASRCIDCGARRVDSQIGLESTPEAFVAELVAVFREVRRVLRDDGTLWLNLGDSYARGFGGGSPGEKSATNVGAYKDRQAGKIPDGLKGKDLIGIPWRVAFALQADGWYLRSDIIWHKPNPMPESVTDRPTKAHEYIFLLSKAERYYYDHTAIQEDATCPDPRMVDGFVPKSVSGKHKGDPQSAEFRKQDALGKRTYTGFNERYALIEPSGKRNKRTVWTVPTSPYRGAHFATFPPALIEPCILAGCPTDGTVLDPFGGAGTTGLVADRFGRNAILCELNPTYAAMARDRIAGDNPMFAEVTLDHP